MGGHGQFQHPIGARWSRALVVGCLRLWRRWRRPRPCSTSSRSVWLWRRSCGQRTTCHRDEIENSWRSRRMMFYTVPFGPACATGRQRRALGPSQAAGLFTVYRVAYQDNLSAHKWLQHHFQNPLKQIGICHILLFSRFVNFAHISTRRRLTVSLEVPLSQQRSSFNQISDVFPQARCPAHF